MLSDRPAPPDDGPAPPDELHGGGPIPMVVPPLPRENPHARNLPWSTAFGLLRAGTLRQTQLMRNYLGSDRVMLAELSLLGSIVYVPETLHFYTVARQTTAPPPFRQVRPGERRNL